MIAVRFQVSESWVRRIKQQRRETGQVAPKTAAGRQPKWQAWADWLVAKIAVKPDIYLRELQAELKQERGDNICLMTICNACRALEQSRKKRHGLPRSRIVRRSPRSGLSGEIPKSTSILLKSYSSMKRGPKPT